MDFEFGVVESLDKVPEQFRGLYHEGDGGKFTVNPDYKGVADAVIGLNKSLKASREDAKKRTTVDLTPLADFGDSPETIKAAVQAKIDELQGELAKGDKAKLNLDKIKEDMAKAHSAELTKEKTRAQALQGQLYKLLVENTATTAIVDAKGTPELLMPFVANQVKVVEEDGEFKVFVVDAQSDRRYSSVTGQPMTIKELIAEMKANEKFGRLFESENDKGGGTGARPGTTQKPPARREELSATAKIAAGLNKNQHRTAGARR